MDVGVSETRQKVLLLLLPAGAPRNFGTNIGLEQTSYRLLYKVITRLLGTAVDFGHACLDGTCRHILGGPDCLKRDRINRRIARTTEGRRAGNQDPSVRVCHVPPPLHTSWGHSSGHCEYRGSAARSGRCGGWCHGEGTSYDHHRHDSPQSTNCKHGRCPRLIGACVWVHKRLGRYTVTTAQGLSWQDRSRTVLGHARGMQGQTGHEHVRASLAESVMTMQTPGYGVTKDDWFLG